MTVYQSEIRIQNTTVYKCLHDTQHPQFLKELMVRDNMVLNVLNNKNNYLLYIYFLY